MNTLPATNEPISAKDIYSEHKILGDAQFAARRYDKYAAEGLRRKINIIKADKAAEKHAKLAKKMAHTYLDEAKRQNDELDAAYESGPNRVAEILGPVKDIKDAGEYLESVLEQLAQKDVLPPYIQLDDGGIVIDGHSMWSYDASPIGMHGIYDTVTLKQRAVISRRDDGYSVDIFPSKSGPQIIGAIRGDALQTIQRRLFLCGGQNNFSALAALTAHHDTEFSEEKGSSYFIPALDTAKSDSDIEFINNLLMGEVHRPFRLA